MMIKAIFSAPFSTMKLSIINPFTISCPDCGYNV
jgi:hypothetical protein